MQNYGHQDKSGVTFEKENIARLKRAVNRGSDYFWNKRGGDPLKIMRESKRQVAADISREVKPIE